MSALPLFCSFKNKDACRLLRFVSGF